MKRKIMIFGTFDGLHPGHQNFFKQAAKFGNVIAIVARDINVENIKSKTPLKNERSRLAKVASEKNIWKASLGDKQDFFQPIKKNQPDVIALGFDQKTFDQKTLQRELKLRNLSPKIIRLKSYQPKKFKSSILRRKQL